MSNKFDSYENDDTASSDLIKVEAIKGLKGDMYVPGDKSISHRAIIISALADGRSELRGFLKSEDTMRTVEAFRGMGVCIEDNGETIVVDGKGVDGLSEPCDVIDAGNSGTTVRLLSGLLSGQGFFSVITGDDSLRSRPMGRITGPLKLMGSNICGREEDQYAPLAIRGGSLRPIDYTSRVASAQVKSALLLAGIFAHGETIVREPFKSRDHTELMLRHCGVDLLSDDKIVSLHGPGRLICNMFEIPGDISSAAFFIVASLITPESDMILRRVGVNPTRTGFIRHLKRMGANIELCNQAVLCGEQVADVHVRSSHLKGINIGPEEIPVTIDEIPILCVAAAFAEGVSEIKGASELRVKESDRISSMTNSLLSFGVDVRELCDGLLINGGRPLKGTRVGSYGDHRVAMSMIVAGLAAKGTTEVEDAGCVNISFPGFTEALDTVIRH